MATVYGGCIEPEGWDLEDEYTTEPCPKCGEPALHWRCERAEGSLNIYTGLACVSCGHEEGERPDVE